LAKARGGSNLMTEENIDKTELDEEIEELAYSSTDLSEEELNDVIEQLCLSKAEEFKLIGYEHVEGREVWECVSNSYTKTGMPSLNRIVNDILSLKVTSFMNWMTMNAYKGIQL
jgi:hypothetical protein